MAGEQPRSGDPMARFWDARAREDAFFFVDNDQSYRGTDLERFWAEGERALDHVLGLLDVAIGENDTVVDIGCGVGRLTRVLAARARAVHAIDVSAEMLSQARELNAHLSNVTWHHGDGTTLQPIPDGVADAVVSHVVFQHIPDPQVTYGYIREMGRVLRVGGVGGLPWAVFQVSNDPAIHEGRYKPPSRLKVLLGRAPRGQRAAEWLGSAVDLGELTAAADDGHLDVERVVGEGTQFCFVRLTRRT
jgi:SAM-dependent methyltransferase